MGNLFTMIFSSEDDSFDDYGDDYDEGGGGTEGDEGGIWSDKVKGCLRKNTREYDEDKGKWVVKEATNYYENEEGQPINSAGQIVDISATDGDADACNFRTVQADKKIMKDSKYGACTEGAFVSTVFQFSGKA